MNNDDDALSSVYKKIERERALLNAANQMSNAMNAASNTVKAVENKAATTNTANTNANHK